MGPKTYLFFLATGLFGLNIVKATDREFNQLPMQSTENEDHPPQDVPRIAIVGAGIAGASTAHHLHQLARLWTPLDITVYEAKGRVGGRIKSVKLRDKSGVIVEVGARSLYDDDWCLKEAMREVGLKPEYRRQFNHRTSVWDGNDFLISYEDDKGPGTGSWRDSLKWVWIYGRSPSQLQSMVKATFDKFSAFAMFQPFRNPEETIHRHSLDEEVARNASGYFSNSPHLTANFINEVIRANARHYASQDLHNVNVLSALASSKRVPMISIYQGNQRLPHRTLKISEASIKLATQVQRISPGKERRWQL